MPCQKREGNTREGESPFRFDHRERRKRRQAARKRALCYLPPCHAARAACCSVEQLAGWGGRLAGGKAKHHAQASGTLYPESFTP